MPDHQFNRVCSLRPLLRKRENQNRRFWTNSQDRLQDSGRTPYSSYDILGMKEILHQLGTIRYNGKKHLPTDAGFLPSTKLGCVGIFSNILKPMPSHTQIDLSISFAIVSPCLMQHPGLCDPAPNFPDGCTNKVMGGFPSSHPSYFIKNCRVSSSFHQPGYFMGYPPWKI